MREKNWSDPLLHNQSTKFSPTKIEELTAGSDEKKFFFENYSADRSGQAQIWSWFEPQWEGLHCVLRLIQPPVILPLLEKKGRVWLDSWQSCAVLFCLIELSALLSLPGKGRVCLRMICTSASFPSFYNLRKNYSLFCQPHSRFLDLLAPYGNVGSKILGEFYRAPQPDLVEHKCANRKCESLL